MYTTTESYPVLFCRLLDAADRLPGSRAAVLGLHWGRWAARQNFKPLEVVIELS